MVAAARWADSMLWSTTARRTTPPTAPARTPGRGCAAPWPGPAGGARCASSPCRCRRRPRSSARWRRRREHPAEQGVGDEQRINVPRLASSIAGMVVTRRSSMTRGLVRPGQPSRRSRESYGWARPSTRCTSRTLTQPTPARPDHLLQRMVDRAPRAGTQGAIHGDSAPSPDWLRNPSPAGNPAERRLSRWANRLCTHSCSRRPSGTRVRRSLPVDPRTPGVR